MLRLTCSFLSFVTCTLFIHRTHTFEQNDSNVARMRSTSDVYAYESLYDGNGAGYGTYGTDGRSSDDVLTEYDVNDIDDE